jgi:hypothetical protein
MELQYTVARVCPSSIRDVHEDMVLLLLLAQKYDSQSFFGKLPRELVVAIVRFAQGQKYQWHWSREEKKKAFVIWTDDEKRVAWRNDDFERNPSIFASVPLSRKRANFAVVLISLGDWIGVGTCTTKIEREKQTFPHWKTNNLLPHRNR